MNCWNKEKILSLFWEAAQLGLKIKNDPHTVLKEDMTPVTLADKTIEDFLAKELLDEETFLIGEETFETKGREYLDKALCGKCWIIDPVDGTANFAASYDTWGISIGFAEKGVIRQGGVYLPEKGELMLTDGDKVLYANCREAATLQDLKNALKEMESPRKPFTGSSMVALSQVVAKNGCIQIHNPVLATGSFVYSAVCLAVGRDGGLITNAKLWDVAGIMPCYARLGIKGGFLGNMKKDVTDCRIDPSYYHLNYTSKDAFRLKDAAVFAEEKATIEKICSVCKLDYTFQ